MRKTNVSEWLLSVASFLGGTNRRIRSSLRRGSSVSAITAFVVLAACLFSVGSADAQSTLTVIHQFASPNPGDMPNSLIQASDGNFYGTTYLGVGTVFQVTPGGQFTTLFVLPASAHTDTRFFYGDFFTSVVEGPDGLLYVIVQGSNNNPNPMLFRISKSGTDYQVVLQEAPIALSAASDGNLYGSDGNGIFRLSTSGTYTLLSSASSNGFTVNSLNKQTTDGNFYGTCYGGSPLYHVCRVTTSGVVTPIVGYPTESDGYALFPANGLLTQGPDGFLYGVGVGGPGGVSYQVIFQVSLSGSYREIYRINHYCNGKTGCSTVTTASDGNLWIADPVGDSVFSITATSGALLQTVSFSSQPNQDAHPNLLLQDKSSGILFGTTGEPYPSYGDAGSVFSINVGPPKPDFSLSVAPTSQTVVQGNGTSYTLTVTPSGGFTGNANLSLSALPAGVNATFNTNPIQNGSGTSTLNVTTTSSTTPGTYSLTITAANGSLTHSATVTLVVNSAAAPDFSLSAAPASQTVVHGNGTSYTLTLTQSNGFAGSVSLSLGALPAGVKATFNTNPIPNGSGTSTLTVTTTSSTTTGTYTLTITGASGSLTHSTSVNLIVRARHG